MSESSEAAEQVVRMMLSGGEVAVRLGGAALKNGGAMLLALAKNHKKVFGKVNLTKMLSMTRDIRTFSLTRTQFKEFKKKAGRMKILYSAVQDKHNRNAPIDIILPVTEIERANVVLEQIKFTPEREKQEVQSDQEQQRKNASRSEPDLHDTRGNFSTRSEKARMTNHDRPSVEQKLKDNKAVLENKKRQAPTRQRTRTKSKGKIK